MNHMGIRMSFPNRIAHSLADLLLATILVIGVQEHVVVQAGLPLIDIINLAIKNRIFGTSVLRDTDTNNETMLKQ